MMRYTLVLLGLCGFWACQDTASTERPREPWVFRSVLDERPRMITMALHDNLWAAYDVQKCELYKAWKGGVNFDGAVYTTKHGPQPNSFGFDFVSNSPSKPSWSLNKNGESVAVEMNYLGHMFQDNQVTLSYQTVHGDQTITVQETPEYVERTKYPGLERRFVVDGLEEGQSLQLDTKLGGLAQAQGFETNGDFQITNSESTVYGGVTTYQVEGQLTLSNGTTNIKSFFKSVERAPAKELEKSESLDLIAAGAQLIENSDCKTCHNPTERTVGPSYTEIAQRYPTSDGTVRELSAKIIEGGTGNWGEVPMTAHPDLEAVDAGRMVHYILSLHEEEEEGNEADHFLGQSSIAMVLSEESPRAAKGAPGLAANLYLKEDHNTGVEEFLEHNQPIQVGAAPALHLVERADFGKFNTNILLEFKGYITVEKETNVDFRLVSDDGSLLYINDKKIIDNEGFHGPEAKDGEVILKAGPNDIRVVYYQGAGGAALSLQWRPYGADSYKVVPGSHFSHDSDQLKESIPYVPAKDLVRSIPGDRQKLQGVHPSFDLSQARPEDFQGRIGGMDFLSDGRLVVCTWDSLGPVYLLNGVEGNDPETIEVKRIATGLAEPLGLKVVNDEIYVLQKQELTKLVDHDGDDIIDEYRTVCDDWKVSANFHEFAFGLAYQDGYFYATLATAINPGGASTQPQIQDRGKVVKISQADGSMEFLAHGLRTPNGIGEGVDQQLFIADNQGDWLPSSKIVHVQPEAWYGSRSVDFEGTASLKETAPVVWLPQDEIGNSPSQPLLLNVGPYRNQMIHGEVTHGGIKRVYVEKVNGQYQGAVFRFTQGLEAGVNRLCWGPEGALYVGGVGSSGNWGDGQKWYGLQRLNFNENITFEMLALKARSNGIEIEFTEPIEHGRGQSADEYLVQQWYYLPTENYGGPKMDLQDLSISNVHMSDDRKNVFLEIPGIKSGHMVYVRLHHPFRSATQQSLWTTEAWYTMNQIPENNPGFENQTAPIAHNTLSDAEKAAGWELLFDGRTTQGWRKFKDTAIGSAWKIREGSLMLDNSNKQGGSIVDGGDIITDQQYENFELTLEWKVEKGGNSGVIYHVVESDEYDYVWQTGPEMQVLDNVNHSDGRIYKHRAGDLYDLIACRFVTANPANKWNKARLISKDGKVSHWLNGYKLVEFEMHNQNWDHMVANSKFKDMPAFGKAKGGHIALQDHNDQVWYRNIKIRQL